jgi:hypothetical protein
MHHPAGDCRQNAIKHYRLRLVLARSTIRREESGRPSGRALLGGVGRALWRAARAAGGPPLHATLINKKFGEVPLAKCDVWRRPGAARHYCCLPSLGAKCAVLALAKRARHRRRGEQRCETCFPRSGHACCGQKPRASGRLRQILKRYIEELRACAFLCCACFADALAGRAETCCGPWLIDQVVCTFLSRATPRIFAH